MKKLYHFIALILLVSPAARAFDGYYLGAQVGHVGIISSTGVPAYDNAIGFGIDLGIRTNPVLDVVFNSQYSSHGGALSLYAETFEANFHLWEFNDFDISLGGGPGFYIFKGTAASETYFGLHLNTAVDVRATDELRIGVGFRYHGIFGAAAPDYYTVMMRVGWVFEGE